MDQTDSQFGSGDESTSQRPSTAASIRKAATKPVTKPITSARLSNLAKPKESPTTRTPATAVTKPPVRPTATVKKSVSYTTAGTGITNTKRNSMISIDSKTSGDESRRDGSSTTRSTRHALTSSTSTVTPTALKRTTTSTSTTSRPGSKSPTTTRTGVRPSANVRPTTTRPLSMSHVPQGRPTIAHRPLSTTAEKKRLSTIQGSPAIRLARDNKSKDLDLTSDSERDRTIPMRTRPPLGTRKSTRSQLMVQQLNEFELVNQMLQAAILADGTDSEEQEALEEQASETMAKLRSTLAKVRYFEKLHGRVPTEAELAEVSLLDLDVEPNFLRINDSSFSGTASPSGDHTLQNELAESRAHAIQLEYQIENMTAKLKELEDSTEAEGEKSSDATEAFRTEHANKMREMSSANQARLDHLRTIQREELEEMRTQHDQAIQEVQAAHQVLIAEKDEQLQSTKSQIEELELRNSNAASNEQEIKALKDDISALNAKLAESEAKTLQDTEQKSAEISHLQAELESAKYKLTQADEKDAELSTLKAQAVDVKSLSTKLQDKDAQIKQLRTEVEALAAKVEPEASVSASRDVSPAKAESQVAELRKKLTAMQTRHQAAKDNAKSKAAKAEEEFSAKLEEALKNHAAALSESQIQIEQLEIKSRDKEAEYEDLKRSHEKEVQTLRKTIEIHVDENARLQDSIKSSSQDALSKLAESGKVVEALRQEVRDLERSREENMNSSSDALEALKSDHSKLLSQIQSELKAAQSELEQVRSTTEKTQKDAVSSLIADLTKAQKELADVQFRHDGQLSKLQQQSEDAMKLTEKEHQRALEKHENSRTDLEIQLATVKKQLHALESEVATTKLDHTENVKALQDEHEKIIADVRTSHASRLKQLETDSAASLAAFDDIEKATNARVADLQNEAQAAKEVALKQQSENYTAMVNNLESEVLKLQEQISSLTKQHETHIEALRLQHSSDKELAANTLREEHAQRLSELENQSKARVKDEVQTLKDTHAQETNRLEEENRNLMSQISGSQFQIQMMKGIMASEEAESKAKEQEHTEALQQVENQFSQAVMRIATHSHQLIAKDAEHAQALDKTRVEMQKQHDEVIEKLKSDHQKTLDDIKRQTNSQLDGLRDRMGAEHARVLEDLRNEVTTKATDMEGLKSNHARALEQLQSRSESTTQEVVAKMKLEHNGQMDSLRAELEASHQTALITTESDFRTMIEKHAADSRTNSDSLRAEHREALTKLSTELAAAQAKAADSTALDMANAELASARNELTTTHTEHDEVLKSVNASHQESISRLEIQIADLTAAVDDAKSRIRPDLSSEVQRLKEVNAQATTLNGSLQKDLSTLKKSHAGLEHKLATATVEVNQFEQQLKEARREIHDLRRSAAIAIDTIASPSPSGSALQAKSDSSVNNAKFSPRTGLSSSRWADDDGSADEKENQPPPSVRAGSSLSNGNQGNGNKTTTSSRNVHSQLAGINEDIRALHDLSEQMLLENRRMAKTLSRVDEDTGVITVEENHD